jgi:hypothetical protein
MAATTGGAEADARDYNKRVSALIVNDEQGCQSSCVHVQHYMIGGRRLRLDQQVLLTN